MTNVKINNEIDLTYPDGYKEMGEEELTRYFGSPANRWGVFDAENHLIISVSWKKSGFFGFLSDAETVMIDAEARLRRTLLNYQRTEFGKMKLTSKKIKAYRIRFEYRVNDSVMVHTGELITFKHKHKNYSIYFVARKSKADSFRPAFEEVVQSVSLS